MLKNILLFSVFVGFFVTLFSCKVTNDEDASVNVDPIFDLVMIEDLQNNRALKFSITSIELQDCENYTIGHNLQSTTSEINIVLNGILAPSDCIVGNQPAITEVQLGTLAIGRVFNTKIDIENTVKNKGKLTVFPDSYLLELESMDGFGSVTERLHKFSNNLIWGYIAYNNEATVGDMVDDFQADLAAIVDNKTLVPGFYGHFSIDENQQLNLLQNPDFQKIKTFYFSNSNDNQALIDLLEAYRNSTNSDEIEFKIFTAEGDVF